MQNVTINYNECDDSLMNIGCPCFIKHGLNSNNIYKGTIIEKDVEKKHLYVSVNIKVMIDNSNELQFIEFTERVANLDPMTTFIKAYPDSLSIRELLVDSMRGTLEIKRLSDIIATDVI